MQITKRGEGQFSYIRGRNFHGELLLQGNVLRLDITEFKKGGIFVKEITNELLQKDFRRFLIFKKTEDLFAELVVNESMEISDENALLLPIEVTFKERVYGLKIQILLQQRKFNNEGEKFQSLFEQIQKMNKEMSKMQRQKIQFKKQSIPELIKFKGDETNAQYKFYEVTENKKRIKFNGTNQHTPFVHEKPLPNKGIFQFKFKIMKTTSKCIFFGVCGKNIRELLNGNLYGSAQFIAGYIYSSNSIYLYGKAPRQVIPGLKIVDGETVITVDVDMNRKMISFYLNNLSLFVAEFWKEMENIQVYPVVSLYTNGDIIQFLDE